jgi:membrane protease YdiL (CAAX protease family)
VPWPSSESARWTAIALFVFALGLHLFVALGGTLAGIDFRTLIILDELGAILLAPLLVAVLMRFDLREAFFLRSAHWSHYLVAGVAAIPLQIWGGAMQEMVIESLPGSDRWRELLEQALEPLLASDSALDLALLMFGAVVLAGICEELLFRGLMLRLLTLGGRWGGAILVTAFAFSLFHLDIIGLIPRTVMGIYFALLVWRSGSIFPAMLAHGLNNLLAFTAIPFLGESEAAPPTFLQAMLLFIGAGIALAVVLRVWWRLSPDDRTAAVAVREQTAAPVDGLDDPAALQPEAPEPSDLAHPMDTASGAGPAEREAD